MKKLKLKALGLGAREILTREQLKGLIGGSDDGSNKCSKSCVTGGTYVACDAVIVQGAYKCDCPGNTSIECH